MKTIVLNEPGKFERKDTEINEELNPGEALVRVRAIGICGTDYHAYRGKQPFFTYPRILGHELGVEIMKIGKNHEGLKQGDYCAVEPYMNCGHCSSCRRGKTNCCVNMNVIGVHSDGGMREYLKLPIHKLHSSPKLSIEELALIETLSIGAHAVDRAQLNEQDLVLVIGAGPIGLSVIQFAKLKNATIVVTDLDQGRLDFCKDQMKVNATVNYGENSINEITKVLGGELPTVVFDATGNKNSMENSFKYVTHGGKLVYVGLFQGEVSFNDPEFHKKEMTLLGSRNSTAKDFKDIIRMMEEGLIDTTPWISHRIKSLENLIKDFEALLKPENKVIKAMVRLE